MPAVPPERPGCPKAPGGRRPLPDPAAIQLFLVPESAPPYDEDVPAAETGGGRLPAWPPHGGQTWRPGDGKPAVRPVHDAEPQDRDSGKPAGRQARYDTRGAPRRPAAAPGAAPRPP